MNIWPDTGQKLLWSYVAQLDLAGTIRSRRPYESVLRRFQKYVVAQAPGKPLAVPTVQSWLRERVRRSSLKVAIRRAQIVAGFLDWLVTQGHTSMNPIGELRQACGRPSTAAVVRALVSPDPTEALKKLRGLPRFGSYLGPIIQDHVERMRNLGFRCDEKPFRRFDEFLQTRSGSASQPFDVLVKEYAASALTLKGEVSRQRAIKFQVALCPQISSVTFD